jgi:hypothetical protein
LLAVSLRCGGDVTVPAEGLPSHVEIISGDDQAGVVGGALPDSLVVRITDSKDRPVVDQPVEFVPVGAGAAQDLIPDTAMTDSDGRAWSRWVLGTQAGAVQVKARALGRSPVEATFTATAQPGAPHALSLVSGAGQTGVAGTMLDDSLLVRVVDQFNNPLENQVVSWTAEDGGSVSDATTSTDALGRAGIRWQLGDQAGLQTSHASITALPSAPLDITATAVPGAAAAVEKVFGDNQSAPVSSDLTDSVVVRVVDAFGNGVPGQNLSWVLVGPGGSVNPGSGTTDAAGEAFTRWSLGPIAGQQVLRAAVPGFAPVSFIANAQSLQPATIAAASNTLLNGTAGQPVTPAPSVEVQDANGNPVSGVTVSFTVVSGGGEVSSGASHGASVNTSTDAAGIAKVGAWTLGPVADQDGEARATGPSGPLSGSPVSFTGVGVPGNPAQLDFLQQPGTAVAGQAMAPPITIAVQDANGNTVLNSSATVTIALGNNQAGGTLGGPTAVDAINGVASFGGLSVDRVGTGYTLVATASGGIHSATSAGFGVVPGPAAQLGIVAAAGRGGEWGSFEPAAGGSTRGRTGESRQSGERGGSGLDYLGWRQPERQHDSHHQ